jgi:hypothetical protein
MRKRNGSASCQVQGPKQKDGLNQVVIFIFQGTGSQRERSLFSSREIMIEMCWEKYNSSHKVAAAPQRHGDGGANDAFVTKL